jgi:hypothetical protein
MNTQKSILIAIDADDYHARYVGRTEDGRQVFVTTPFIADKKGRSARSFVAVYLFDLVGNLAEAIIQDLGRQLLIGQVQEQIDKHAVALGGITPGRILVRPFEVQRFGIAFGLILRSPDRADDPPCVEAQLGNYMAFFEPWDNGTYDT